MQTAGMVAIPPITAEVELAIADALSGGAFSPVDELLDAIGDEPEASAARGTPLWDCRDTTEWSPGMWWLLNWWTWQYPAPCIDVTIVAPDGHAAPERPVQIEVDSDDGVRLGPALADLGADAERQGPPPPPIAREIVEQLVVRGDCFVDLLA